MQNAVYDASALLETAKERISSYNEMEKQLLVLQKAFKRIAALDEDLQGKGADNIKAFYQSHADIANQWLNLIETNRAFFETIEAKMGTSELEGSTFVAEAFLDQNVHQGNTQAKEMIIQQQNALQDIFNTIDHILPLNVFSSAKYNQYLEEAEQERKDTLQAVNQLDADLVQEYKGLSFFYNMVTQNIQAVTSSTSQAGNATPLYFDLDAYKASPVYGMQGEANSRAVSYVEAKEAERKAYENQKNIQAQESFTLEVCENPHAKKKEEKGFWGAAWGSVTSGVEHAWDKTMDGFHAGVDKVTHGTEAAWTATKTGWNTGVQAVSDGVKDMKHTAHETWADVQSQAAAGLAKAKVSTKLAIEVYKESWKVSIENIKQGTKTALDVTKRSWDGVAGGATDAVVDTWNDLVHMVQHPVETAESIGEGVKAVWDDPKGVAKTIGNEIKDSWNEQVINGDAKSRGHYFSYLTANVAMSIVGTKGADKLAKTTKLEQLSGAATKKLNEGAAAIHVRTQSALQNLGLNKLDNRLAYPGVGSVKGNGGYQFIERVDGGNGVGTKVRDEKVIDGTGEGSRIIPGTPGIVTGGNSTKLGKNMMTEMWLRRSTKWSGYQAQHIIPSEMADNPVIKKIGMNFDDSSNGIFLRVPDDNISTMARHRGYHSIYNEVVARALNKMDINQSIDSLQKQVYDLQKNLRKLQGNGLPLYPSQGATVELWERKLKKLEIQNK